MNEKNALSVFEGKKIRKDWFEEEWWFSVVDAVEALTESTDAKDYWYRLKKRELETSEIELSTFCRQLKLRAEDGKLRETDCANTEGLFRIIQSIPSPKAEPFKLWLAKVGYDRVKEIENPELMTKRQAEIYKQKGYSDEWIEKRLRGIAIRQELTEEWKQRDVDESREFAILTNEISKATFGKTVSEYKEFKGLDKHNLRDHMNDLELIFTMLGEKVTSETARNKDAKGFEQNKEVAKDAGKIVGSSREASEKLIGKPIISGENYLTIPEKVKRKQICNKN